MLEIQGKYNTAKVFTENIENEAYTQILNMMCQIWAKDMNVAIMPDVHAGKGCTVGTTMTIKDKIVPNLVGVDIRAKKESAYKELLKDAKIPEKRFESIIKLSGDSIDKIELDDSGELKNKDDIVDSINNDWSEYAQVIEEQGASTPKPPANNGGSDKKISRAKQIAQQYHEDMYGKIKED